MSARTINGVDEMKALVGEHLGYSPYVEITQEQVNLFADATGDHQWIHIDVERAKAGPFGGPIAHGYLTLSLGPSLYSQIVEISPGCSPKPASAATRNAPTSHPTGPDRTISGSSPTTGSNTSSR
ncbi:MAG: dehydratase [Actinobacteria bacterium]|nr:dehydratase [Actinomycetota bacterium]